jgi:osmotically-inducible protein OsmY
MKTDADLQRDVQEELKWEPTLHPAEIGVTAREGVVTLTGHVESYAAKFAAERAAKRVSGVKGLAEEIEVRLPGLSRRTDAEIAQAALNAMEWDVWVPNKDVQVIVENGLISLEGQVERQYQKTAAERAVRHLMGVKGVVNKITVKPKVKSTEVKAKIAAALKRNAEIDAQRIRVEASNGSVILRGEVRSWFEREEAERAAWAAPGVSEVEDHIQITT